MVTVKGEILLDVFRERVLEVARKYHLTIGYPSGPKLPLGHYIDNPNQVPIPIDLTGYSIRNDLREKVAQELGVAFERDQTYGDMLHKGVKRLHNPDSGVQYEFSISLWDTSSFLFSS